MLTGTPTESQAPPSISAGGLGTPPDLNPFLLLVLPLLPDTPDPSLPHGSAMGKWRHPLQDSAPAQPGPDASFFLAFPLGVWLGDSVTQGPVPVGWTGWNWFMGSWGCGPGAGDPSAWGPVPLGGWSRVQAGCPHVLFAEGWTKQALRDSPPFPALLSHSLSPSSPHPHPSHGLGIRGLAGSGLLQSLGGVAVQGLLRTAEQGEEGRARLWGPAGFLTVLCLPRCFSG